MPGRAVSELGEALLRHLRLLHIEIFQALPLGQFRQSGIVHPAASLKSEFLHFLERAQRAKAGGADVGESQVEHAQIFQLLRSL